jgi:hypothetical protein
MYRCELCKEVVAPNVPSHRVTIETREVRYPYRAGANRPAPQAKKHEKRDDPGGSGREIVREVMACPRCAGKA